MPVSICVRKSVSAVDPQRPGQTPVAFGGKGNRFGREENSETRKVPLKVE
jgi:hypothetical protein